MVPTLPQRLRPIVPLPSADRRELEVEPVVPAQHPGRRVGPTAGPGRPVVGFGYPYVLHPVEQALQGDVGLGPGERGAGTGVDPVPEGDVLAQVLPVQP